MQICQKLFVLFAKHPFETPGNYIFVTTPLASKTWFPRHSPVSFDSSVSKMANANEHFMLLFLLYFGQGLPYGFQVKLLPLILRKHNFSLSKVGLSRLLSLPWIFKFTVAPLVDNLWSLNTWIIAGSLVMSLLCFISAFFAVNNTVFLLVCVFGMNLTSAVQDVAVDTFAINLLKPSDLGNDELIS